MRIWSIHPQYLDAKGLVALWRETLLAKHVLEGKTKGYQHHPQLYRFRQLPAPGEAINQYLSNIYEESLARGYFFDKEKINPNFNPCILHVRKGQMDYERVHLLSKLRIRDPKRFRELRTLERFKPHPMFRIVRGSIEPWERPGP